MVCRLVHQDSGLVLVRGLHPVRTEVDVVLAVLVQSTIRREGIGPGATLGTCGLLVPRRLRVAGAPDVGDGSARARGLLRGVRWIDEVEPLLELSVHEVHRLHNALLHLRRAQASSASEPSRLSGGRIPAAELPQDGGKPRLALGQAGGDLGIVRSCYGTTSLLEECGGSLDLHIAAQSRKEAEQIGDTLDELPCAVVQ